jgi:hypothetical protein
VTFPEQDRYAPDGTPREPVTEARLQEVAEAVRVTAQNIHRGWPGDAQALHDIADYLVGTYGAPGTYWPQRLPVKDEGEK